jgi:Fe2+ transport system protein FeoA
MTQTVNLKFSKLPKLREFQEFIFIGNSSAQVQTDSLKQLHDPPNTQCLNANSTGSFLLIAQIHTPKQITRQLSRLKLKRGKTVQLISKTKNGSVVITYNDKLIGIGATIAQKIIVTSASQTR